MCTLQGKRKKSFLLLLLTKTECGVYKENSHRTYIFFCPQMSKKTKKKILPNAKDKILRSVWEDKGPVVMLWFVSVVAGCTVSFCFGHLKCDAKKSSAVCLESL